MAHTLLPLILKILFVATGVFLIVTRLFVYEKTQGRIQSRIEDLWIKIDDYEQYALFKHTGFMQTVAGIMSRALDRVFGTKLCSLRALIISVCYGFAAFFFAVILLLRYSTGTWDSDYILFIFIYLVTGTAPLIFSYIPDEQDRRVYLAVWMTASLITAMHTIVKPYYELVKLIYDSNVKFLVWFILGIGLCVLIALFLFASFLMLIRLSLRTIQSSTSLFKTALVSLLNIAPIFTFYGLLKLLTYRFSNSSYLNSPRDALNPQGLEVLWANWSARIDMFVFILLLMVFLFDIIFIITAAIFAIVSLLLFLHRMLWPVVSRLLYASQRFSIIKSGNILIYIGAVLIILGLGKISWLKAFFNIL
jgi:hypothetical protein